MRKNFAAIALLMLPLAVVSAQDPEGKIDLPQVVEKPDAKTMVDKASCLIGFNFWSSAKQQPQADMQQVLAGMKAAMDGEDKTSFIAGYQMMERIMEQGAELDLAQIKEGMRRAEAGEEVGMTEEEIQMLMTSFSNMLQEKMAAKLKAESDANLAAGEAYIKQQVAENPSMKKLDNGCYYTVLKEGTGATPTKEDRVRVHYTGQFIDGEVFDSSVNPPSGRPAEPADFPVAGVVPGFSETLQNMKVGGKWRVLIPGPQAYGARGKGEIGPNEMLVFEIELLEILGD